MTLRLQQFFGFLAAGGTATLLNYAFFVFLYWLGTGHLLASAAGYVSGIAVSFTINKRLVFQAGTSHDGELPRYVTVYLLALVLQLGILELGVQAGGNPLMTNAIALAIVVMVTFFAIRRYVFRPASTPIAAETAGPTRVRHAHAQETNDFDQDSPNRECRGPE